MADSILRRLAMLRALPVYPRKIDTASLLRALEAQGYGTTLRTIQRDLEKLSAVLPLTNDGNAGQFGWFWQKDAPRLDLPQIEPQVALTLKLAEAHLSQILPHRCIEHLQRYFSLASQMLGAGSSNSFATWNEKVAVAQRGQRLLSPHVDPSVMDVVSDALLDERCIDVDYLTADSDEIRTATVHPLGIVVREPLLYLVCRFWRYENIRQLAMHRIVSAQVTDEQVVRPNDFSLGRYVEDNSVDIQVGEVIELHLRVSEHYRGYLEESPLVPNQYWRSDGTDHVMVASVKDTVQLRRWLLSLTGEIDVLRPESLRSYVLSTLEAQIENYKKRR